MNYTFALCGNPNVGKTSLYNRLTRSSQHVGNWHGVTVGKVEKEVDINGDKIKISDLPGLYSLTVYSQEESITRDDILTSKNDLIVSVCEANNLARNLYLTLQLLELGVPVLIVVNMIDELTKRGLFFDSQKLEERLKVPVLTTSAKYKFDTSELLKQGISALHSSKCMVDLPYLSKLPIGKVQDIIAPNIKDSKLNKRYACIKVLEKDNFVIDKLQLNDEQKKNLNALGDTQSLVARSRYDYIDTIVDGIISSKKKEPKKSITNVIDKVVLNKYAALPIFILIMSGIFWVTFGSIGNFLTDLLGYAISDLSNFVCTILKDISAPEWVIGLICQGIIEGVGSVLTFLPQIVIMFFFLALLEDSGYISRLAFTTDGLFGKIGLSGRAVFTMIMGLGCSATAVMTARGLEDEMMRKKTVILTPFMSCSARLPVYTAIAAAFFSSGNVPMIIGLYLLGALMVVIFAAIFEKTPLKSGEASFVMEMPKYRMPTLTRIFQILLNSAKNFIIKVGTTVFAFNVIVWVLGNFSFTHGFVALGNGESVMESVGSLLAPIFAPLGFGNWKAVTALISGLAAKEVVISTITSLGGMGEIFPDSLAAITFMVYTLLYVPCTATLSSIRREVGVKWMIFGMMLQLSSAYIVAFAIRSIIAAFIKSIMLGIIAVGCTVISIILLGYLIEAIFKNRKCIRCVGACERCK